jgi:SAM-dependent methyltransferase
LTVHPVAAAGFGAAADVYERARPSYPADAVAWLVERAGIGPGATVADVGAGTGKLTRLLVPTGARVLAVEPLPEMRERLLRLVPEAEALDGTAETLPLEDASVDAITVAQAFHWFDAAAAITEMHRVLRPGGGLALLWNEWDRDDALLASLDAIVDRLRPEGVRDAGKRDALESSPLFTPLEERRFRHSETLTGETVVERVASVSAIAAASGRDRERALDEVRELVGPATVDFPMITTVLACNRV